MRTKIYYILFLLAFFYSKEIVCQEKLNVLSYNIRIASPPSKGWGITELQSIADVINRNPSDLIALQEVDRFTTRSGVSSDQAKELGQLTKMYHFFAKAVDRSGGDYGVAILSKFPILHAESHRIYSQDSIKHEHRALAIAKVNWNNEEIIFASFHLDHLSDSTRKYQLHQIFNHLEKYKNNKIIMGADLNCLPDNSLLQEIESHGYSFVKENLKTPTFPNDNPKSTLDYFMLNNWNKNNIKTFQVLKHEHYASDHLPIKITIQSK